MYAFLTNEFKHFLCLQYAGLSAKEPSKRTSNLLYSLVGKLKPSIKNRTKFLVESIVKEDLDSEQRVAG